MTSKRKAGLDAAGAPTRAIKYALGANLAIAVAKFAGAAVSGSGALLAEGLHSLADAGNEVLLLWGRRQALAAPTPDHPLGFGRASYFWSFMVALLLFSAGGISSIYEGMQRMSEPRPIEKPWIALGVLLLAACAEGTAQAVALKQINRLRGSRSLWRWLRETRRSELIVVFAEDAAALVGIAIAAAAIVASSITGNGIYDGLGSIAVGGLLIVVAILLGIETKSLLIGESAGPTVRRALLEFLQAQSEIDQVVELITSQHGEHVELGIKAIMRRQTSDQKLVAAVQACEASLREAFPQVRWVFFQPVLPSNAQLGCNAIKPES